MDFWCRRYLTRMCSILLNRLKDRAINHMPKKNTKRTRTKNNIRYSDPIKGAFYDLFHYESESKLINYRELNLVNINELKLIDANQLRLIDFSYFKLIDKNYMASLIHIPTIFAFVQYVGAFALTSALLLGIFAMYSAFLSSTVRNVEQMASVYYEDRLNEIAGVGDEVGTGNQQGQQLLVANRINEVGQVENQPNEKVQVNETEKSNLPKSSRVVVVGREGAVAGSMDAGDVSKDVGEVSKDEGEVSMDEGEVSMDEGEVSRDSFVNSSGMYVENRGESTELSYNKETEKDPSKMVNDADNIRVTYVKRNFMTDNPDFAVENSNINGEVGMSDESSNSTNTKGLVGEDGTSANRRVTSSAKASSYIDPVSKKLLVRKESGDERIFRVYEVDKEPKELAYSGNILGTSTTSATTIKDKVDALSKVSTEPVCSFSYGKNKLASGASLYLGDMTDGKIYIDYRNDASMSTAEVNSDLMGTSGVIDYIDLSMFEDVENIEVNVLNDNSEFIGSCRLSVAESTMASL